MAEAPVSVRILVRAFLHSVSTLIIAVGVVACSDSPPAPVRHGATDARVALQPVFSRSAVDASRRLSDFGIRYDRVRVVLARAAADTIRDTTIAFVPGQPDVTFDLTVPVRTNDEMFDVSIDYLGATGPVFHGHGQAHARLASQTSMDQEPITIEYVGPGANVARIELSPKTVTVFGGRPTSFVAAAFDSSDRGVQTVPLAWATSDASIATITRDGVLTPTGKPGAVRISVITPTAVTDSAAATILLPPASISVVSGSGQTGSVGQLLAPLVVAVTDRLGAAVPGVEVNWARTAGSGSLAASTSITDADGRATTSYALGSVVGAESVSATVDGVASAAVFSFQSLGSIAAKILVVSGDGQVARVNTELTAPLVVSVVDAAGHTVAGALVSWSAVNGTVAPTSSTDANGRASAVMTLGSRAGSASATAAIANGQRVTFSATAQPGPVVAIAFSAQPSNGIVGSLLSPVRVSLLDANGNQTSATNSVSIALANNSTGAMLAGTLQRNAVAGVATFDDLKIDQAGNGYSLIAHSGSLPAIASSPFNVSSGPAGGATIAVLAGDNQSATVGSTTPVAPAVRVTSAQGSPVSGVQVTFSPYEESGTVTPSGPVVTNDAGVATLTSWRLGTEAGRQTLIVSAAGAQSVAMHATAQPAPAAKLVIVTQPSTATRSNELLAQQPVIQVQDQYGNAAKLTDLVITVSSNGGTLHGTTSVTASPATGLAVFTDLRIVGSGVTTLSFSAPGLPAVTSSPIVVSSSVP